MRDISLLLIIFGVFLVVIGVILNFGWKIPLLGRLPGDILIDKENFKFYFPLTSTILISLIISFVMKLLGK